MPGFSRALGEHLSAGGRAYVSCLGCDTAAEPLEQRIRGMLGPAQEEFAVLVAEWESLPAVEFVMRLVEAGELDFDRGQRQVAAFRDAGVTQLVRCAVVAARQPESGAARTMRRKMGARTTAEELDAAFEPLPPLPGELLDLPLRVSPWLRLEREAVLHGGEWRDASIILDAQHPFAFRTDCPRWAADMLPRLNGEITPRELLQLYADLDEAEIFLECLLDAGVLRLGAR